MLFFNYYFYFLDSYLQIFFLLYSVVTVNKKQQKAITRNKSTSLGYEPRFYSFQAYHFKPLSLRPSYRGQLHYKMTGILLKHFCKSFIFTRPILFFA